MKGDKLHNASKVVLLQVVEDNPMLCVYEEVNESVLGVHFNDKLITFPTRIMSTEAVIMHCNDWMTKQNKKGRGPYKLIEI